LVAAVAIVVLTGSRMGATRHLQVYFAVGVGCVAGVFVTGKILPVRNPIWFWPMPLLLGVVGLVVAGVNPAVMLPAGHTHLDTIPAWGLVRPLPVEMTGVGVLAVLWMMGGEAHTEQDDAGA
jgi:hypothetical protein